MWPRASWSVLERAVDEAGKALQAVLARHPEGRRLDSKGEVREGTGQASVSAMCPETTVLHKKTFGVDINDWNQLY